MGSSCRLAILSLLTLALSTHGCRTTGPTAPQNSSPAFGSRAAERLVVLPLNVAIALPAELEEPSEFVWEEIWAYLKAQDKRLQTLEPSDARRLWLKSIRQVTDRSEEGFEEAARLFVFELNKHAEFDAVIVPSLFLTHVPFFTTPVPSHMRWVSWDGVRRRVEMVDEPKGVESIDVAAAASLLIKTASLHVAVFDAQGAKIHSGKGGLDLIERMEPAGRHRSAVDRQWVPAIRPDLFQDQAHLREGVGLAFDPFLPPLDDE